MATLAGEPLYRACGRHIASAAWRRAGRRASPQAPAEWQSIYRHGRRPEADGRLRNDGLGGRTDRRSRRPNRGRSEEQTSELQSLMRKSYAVFCLKKKKTKT